MKLEFFLNSVDFAIVSWTDLWDTEEAGVDIDKHVASEKEKVIAPVKDDLTEAGSKELVKETPGEVKTELTELAGQHTAAVEKHEKSISETEANKLQDPNDKLSEGERLEVKGKQHSVEDSPESMAQTTEQTPETQLDNQETSDLQYQATSPSEPSQTLTEDRSSDKASDGGLQTASHKRVNSSGSVDSSWSKVSEEELKQEGIVCSSGEVVSVENCTCDLTVCNSNSF